LRGLARGGIVTDENRQADTHDNRDRGEQPRTPARHRGGQGIPHHVYNPFSLLNINQLK
jgi:hypothetical protein